MQLKLRQYQERAVEDMIKWRFHYLAYEMGVGKTLMVLEYLKRTNQKGLVIAPLLVAQHTWPAEVKKFGYPFKVALLHGPGKDVLLRTDAELKVINYDGIKWLGEQIEGRGSHDLSKRVLILDESTYIKSVSSKRFEVLRRAQHFFKAGIFCLSGTPMPNGYPDLWTQYWMLDRGRALESTYTEYKRKYFYESGPPRFIVSLKPGSAERIQERVKPLTSTLFAEDYVEMPDSTYTTWHVDLPKEVMEEYDKYQEETPFLSEGTMTNKLRQITQGALYINDEGAFDIKHFEKVNALKEILELANGSPILCPIQFRFEARMIRDYFYKIIDIPLIAGGMNATEKLDILSKWDRGKLPLLLVHPASLSHGVNMQFGGHWIVWYGLPWSLEQYQQLNGRLIRPGQTEPVKVIHIAAIGTKDQRVFKVLEDKDVTQAAFKEAMR